MYVTPYSILDNIYIKFDTELYRQIFNSMVTNCAPLVAFLHFAMTEISSLSDDNEPDIIEAFNQPQDIWTIF